METPYNDEMNIIYKGREFEVHFMKCGDYAELVVVKMIHNNKARSIQTNDDFDAFALEALNA